jgi:hypothetical protein
MCKHPWVRIPPLPPDLSPKMLILLKYLFRLTDASPAASPTLRRNAPARFVPLRNMDAIRRGASILEVMREGTGAGTKSPPGANLTGGGYSWNCGHGDLPPLAGPAIDRPRDGAAPPPASRTLPVIRRTRPASVNRWHPQGWQRPPCPASRSALNPCARPASERLGKKPC